jgi:NAD-dependent SIR2 family protein deacetylase
MPHGAFVITSNVDGQFQKAGFEELRVLEVHGSIHRLQCCGPCCSIVWSAQNIEPTVNNARCEWVGNNLPTCDRCRKIARPNILMFDDWDWNSVHTENQRTALEIWSSKSTRRVVVELGAGIDIPTIRYTSLAQGCPVIRINTRHAELPEGMGVSLPMGAKAALSTIADELSNIGWLKSKSD